MPWIEGDGLTPTNLNTKMGSGIGYNVQDVTFGAVGDGVTDDTAAIQAAIDAVEAAGNGSVFFPPGRYLVSALTVTGDGVAFVSMSSGIASTLGVYLEHTANSGNMLTVSGNRFMMNGIVLVGTSDDTERGEDVTSVGILFDPTSTADIDATLYNCAIAYFQDGIRVEGRNVRCQNVTLTACKRGAYVPTGIPSDSRNLEMYGCRFHAIGKAGASNTGGVYCDPTANFQEVVISSFDCDSCTRLFYGFASGMVISGGPMNKMLGTGITIDSAGMTLNLGRRIGLIDGVTYWQINPTDIAASGIEIIDSAFGMTISNAIISDTGGHGVSVAADFISLSNVVVHSPGQFADNTYDGFNITGSGVALHGCTAYQDRLTSATTKGRNGFTITGDDCRVTGLMADSAYASSLFSLGDTVEVWGIEPRTPTRHESWGTQAPTEGTWRTGDVLWRTNPSYGTGVGFVCTGGGAPGTWHPFGQVGFGTSAILPSYPFGPSEISLGWYRSAASTVALSYGTLAASTITTNVLRVTSGATIASGNLVLSDGSIVMAQGKVVIASEQNAARPEYTFNADVDTGVFQPATDAVGIAAGGAEKFRVAVSTASFSGVTLDLSRAKFSMATTGTSLNSTNLGIEELRLYVGGTSGATLAVRSGGTIYYFSSSLSTVG